MQDFWRLEEDQLFHEPGSGRRWTSAHVPERWADGSPAKLTWTREEQTQALSAIARAADRLPEGAFAPRETARQSRPGSAVARYGSRWALPLDGVVIQRLPEISEHLPFYRLRHACILGELDLPDTLTAGGEFTNCLVYGALSAVLDSDELRFGRTIVRGHAGFGGSFHTLNCAGATFLADGDFSECTIKRARFKRTIFAAAADFRSANLSRAAFEEAKFCGPSTFDNGTLGISDWTDSEFGRASFVSTRLGAADFNRVAFAGSTSFRSASFEKPALFRSVTWAEAADFSHASLQEPDFEQARFEASADFEEAKFIGHVNFERVQWLGPTALDGIHWPSDPTKYAGAFRGARFQAYTSFGPNFSAFAAFDGAEFKGEARIEGERAECDAAFAAALNAGRAASVLGNLEHGLRAVRQAAEGARNRPLEQTLFRQELRAHRARVQWWKGESLLSGLYGITSGYGLSFAKPLAWITVLWLAFAALYYWLAAFAGLELQGGWTIGGSLHPDLAQVAQLSARSTFNLFGVWSLRPPSPGAQQTLEDALLWSRPGLGFWIRGVSTLESILSGILLFLCALGIRRRFQIS